MSTCHLEYDELTRELIEQADDFARAASESAVWSAVAHHARRVLGASHALVLRRGQASHPDCTAFSPVFVAPDAGEVKPFQAVAPLSGMGLVAAPPAPSMGAPYRPLFDALAALAPAGLVYAPLNLRDVLVLVYRTEVPTVDRLGWVLLEALTAQAGSALARVRAIARVAELSLRDNVTGLGTRRLLELILEHSFPQALRGDPLTVVAIRPPPEPAAHADARDERVAQLLRLHVRESDVLVRLEDGLFVIILHSCAAPGADLFTTRVAADLPGVETRWLVAEPDGRFETPNDLLAAVLEQLGPVNVN
jgi:GGDEF domain-containing protein